MAKDHLTLGKDILSSLGADLSYWASTSFQQYLWDVKGFIYLWCKKEYKQYKQGWIGPTQKNWVADFYQYMILNSHKRMDILLGHSEVSWCH